MERVNLLMKRGIAVTSAMLLVGAVPCTAVLAEGDSVDGGNATASVETVEVPQSAENDQIGYDVQDSWLTDRYNSVNDSERLQGLNVFSVNSNGEHVQSTFSNSCYETFVDNTDTPINENSFAYGQAYERNGIVTRITPTLGEDSVTFTYDMQNNSNEDRSFTVGTAADIMMGAERSDDYASIYGDETAFTMTNGTNALQISSGDNAFDNLWYGFYGNVLRHFNDNAVLNSRVDDVDSGVVWGWNINLAPGQTATRTAGFRIGEHTRIVTSPELISVFAPVVAGAVETEEPAAEAPVAVEEPVAEPVVVAAPVEDAEAVEYVETKKSSEPVVSAPKVWTAWTEKGQQLPITNMGVAEATTETLYVDIFGSSTLQYKDAIKKYFAKAPADGVFVLGTNEVSTVDREIIETFASRNNVTIEIVFPYEGQVYEVKIPAGADLSTVLDDCGFAGYLKIASIFGSTVIG